MKKWISILLALALCLPFSACGQEASSAPESGPSDRSNGAGPLSEEEAAVLRDTGTLQADPLTGYDYSDATGIWYYSNYPNYKDFNADGKIKVAFVCKFSGSWFTPKADSLGKTIQDAGYEYLFIDANSDEQAWLDGVQNVINQEFDFVVLTPVNTALLADAVSLLQDAGIAYMTTDDPGADAHGFYVPHYGLDDYAMYHGLGQAAADKMKNENFLDGVADDYSNFLFIIMDSPSVEAIHNRSQGYYDAIKEAYPDIPEDRILWLDCGAGLTDDIIEKLTPTLQANMGTVDKWLLASGTGSAFIPSVTLLQENQIDFSNVILSETCADNSVLDPMLGNAAISSSSILCGLVSAPSGVGMGNLIVDLMENGTPLPCFTGYDLIIVDQDSAQKFRDTYFSN